MGIYLSDLRRPGLPLPLGEVPRRAERAKPSQSQLSLCQLSQRESQGVLRDPFDKLELA